MNPLLPNSILRIFKTPRFLLLDGRQLRLMPGGLEVMMQVQVVGQSLLVMVFMQLQMMIQVEVLLQVKIT